MTTLPYSQFWTWFQTQAPAFRQVIETREGVEERFLLPVKRQMDSLVPGMQLLVGVLVDGTLDMVITADGDVSLFVFVEELVDEAPAVDGWQFTPFKESVEDLGLAIHFGEQRISLADLSFIPMEDPDRPEQVHLTIVVRGLAQGQAQEHEPGVRLLLEQYLGEVRMATQVDTLQVAGEEAGQGNAAPISKLADYLLWRQKESEDRYREVTHDSSQDKWGSMEFQTPEGGYYIGTFNMSLLDWDLKPSHPWMVIYEVPYDGSQNGGMPEEAVYSELTALDDWVAEQLPEQEGHLLLGAFTGDNCRIGYVACRDHRTVSKVMHRLKASQQGTREISYHVFQDKYWDCMERYRPG